MSSAPFPERIDAVKMFARMGSIAAELPLARLQRFTEQLSSKAGAVAVDLQFGRDEEGRRLLSAAINASVHVACQRCLQDMELDLGCSLSLAVFDSEAELQGLPDSQDGVVMTDDGLDVVALIEDELILSLPMIPMHADTGCNRVLNELKQGESVADDRPSPFAVLAGLKVAGDTTKDRKGREDSKKGSKKSHAKPNKPAPQGTGAKPPGKKT